MGAAVRLKREEFKHTKHDSAFSHWKILIGPSDWNDYLLNKDGAEKYRTQNLPNRASCPGLYELGVPVPVLCQQSGREFGSDFVIPVYLGQANNVRTRLQRYGREGAHLESGFDCRGQGLFTEIFSRGFSIVYRWAPLNTKKDAEEMEARLLDTFDYAWNRGSNGARRPNDILQKLDCNDYRAWSHPIIRKLQFFSRRKVGLRIKTCENESNFDANQESKNIFSRIFKFVKSRPISVSSRFDANEDSSICGVALGQGSVCKMPPVEGRKRCNQHKGMKVNGSASKLNSDSQIIDTGRQPILTSDPGSMKPQLDKCPENEDLAFSCGIALGDGSLCTKKPIRGRKRCEEHKGRKNRGSTTKPVKEEIKYCVDVPNLERKTLCDNSELLFAGTHKLESSDSTDKTSVNKDYNGTCRGPAKMENVTGLKEGSSTCGSRTLGGSYCRRKPSKDNKWCWQHQGKRVDRISKVGACNE